MTWESQEERDALADDRDRELWITLPRPCGAAESEGDGMSDEIKRYTANYIAFVRSFSPLQEFVTVKDHQQAIAARDETITRAIHLTQRHQPGGSPPPGDWVTLLQWVLDDKEQTIAKQAQQIADSTAQCDALRSSVDELARANQTLITQIREQAQRIEDYAGIIAACERRIEELEGRNLTAWKAIGAKDTRIAELEADTQHLEGEISLHRCFGRNPEEVDRQLRKRVGELERIIAAHAETDMIKMGFVPAQQQEAPESKEK